ncbi:MAG: hypothetical protein H6713_12115 [Myxococcales bacterium]|nr:hypothetical protein [Myxococcales bacterium]
MERETSTGRQAWTGSGACSETDEHAGLDGQLDVDASAGVGEHAGIDGQLDVGVRTRGVDGRAGLTQPARRGRANAGRGRARERGA